MYDIPGRPVISDCGFYTENISAFLDHQLKPITIYVKSYIKDNNDFLEKLRGLPDLPEESIICTIDAIGLYPSIPNKEGRRFLRNVLEKKSNKKTWLWWRYIDDIFMIWQHGEDELKLFLEKLNNFHPSIKFTCEYSHEKVNYLDVQVVVREGKLRTDMLYVKQTDSYQYLDPSSCHPCHCTKLIPYSQALKINWICLEKVSFDLWCNKLEEWLIKRNYNLTVVRKQILKTRAFLRDTLLDKVKEVRNNDRLVLTLIYHSSIKNFQNALNEAHILLTPNKEHHKIFGDKPPMIGWRM